MNAPEETLPAVIVDKPLTLVIFGATGDLTKRKLIPGLYVMFMEGLLPPQFRLVAFGRREFTDETFRDAMREGVNAHSRLPVDDDKLETFLAQIDYHKGNLDDAASYVSMRERFEEAEVYPGNKVYYLAISPQFFSPVIALLKGNGLISPYGVTPWTRVVIEKPFGRDLKSALELNREVLTHLDESQVYRIDHYLGKETAQNILSFRFANAIFEPVFNNHYVDHIQVTASESLGMESGRGGYYDSSGALRDMLQNHLMQVLCLVTMEPPSGLAADAVRNEKVKILQSIRPPTAEEVRCNFVRGQYDEGAGADGETIPSYRGEDRVPGDSTTETFVAARFYIENWRWAGVPMYVRTGKRLARKTTTISVHFKVPPLKLFTSVQCQDDVCDLTHTQPNVLTFHIAPEPSISLSFSAKRPAMQVVVESAKMDFKYSETWNKSLPEAYERLLLDVMRGDSTLFTRSDEVEAAWGVVDPILNGWANDPEIPLHTYGPGSWGPDAASEMFHDPSRDWVNE